MEFKSILGSPQTSVGVGMAALALVVGIYNNKAGTISSIHMTAANDTNIHDSIHKAGMESVALVAGLFLVTHDMNVVIMGSAAIVAEELSYRHANMVSADTGKIEIAPSDYSQQATQYSVDQGTSYLEQ